jgi:hypothetical protein
VQPPLVPHLARVPASLLAQLLAVPRMAQSLKLKCKIDVQVVT